MVPFPPFIPVITGLVSRFFRFFTVSSTKTKCLVARGLRPSAIRRRFRKGHPSQPRRPSGWLGAHAWTPPSRPPIQERGPRRRPPQNLEIERANDRNTPIFIGLQLLQKPLMRVLKSTKSPFLAERPSRMNRPSACTYLWYVLLDLYYLLVRVFRRRLRGVSPGV